MKRLLLIALTLAVVASPSSSLAQTAPDPRFGIDEGLSDAQTMADFGAGWDRVLVPWYRIQPRAADDFAGLGRALPERAIRDEAARGVHVAGVLNYTPGWAARNPDDGLRGAPRDPADFGRFVFQTVQYYAGRIDEWIIWNEPDYRPGDQAGDGAVTWLGSDDDLAALIKAGYLAAKAANPRAIVSFPATAYWIDAVNNRSPLYDRVLDIFSRDPDAAAQHYYHDAVSLNIYHRPDEIYRIHGIYKDIQRQYGIDASTPVWLTETNSMPIDDVAANCWERHTRATEPFPTSLDEQAAFAVQALAMAAAAGYERIGWWRMIDGRACNQTGLFGAVRDDGSHRPVADALRTTIRLLSGYTSAQVMRNGSVYQVVADKPGPQRVTVLWNGDRAPVDVHVSRSGSTARAYSMLGVEQSLTPDGDGWSLELPGATAYAPGDPPGYHYIGGEPTFLVEGPSP
jgi:hypothetical protein